MRTRDRESTSTIEDVLGMLSAGEARARHALSFTPPENVLSPLARTPFVLDLNARYFFDHKAMFGSWAFFGALEAGKIEQDVLLPMLREAIGAAFVDVRPLSGLHCMTIAMGGLCKPGDAIMTIAVEAGGHMCTADVAKRLGLRVAHLPMRSAYDVDLDRTAAVLQELRPTAIYIDQSAQLFPIDPQHLREAVDRSSPGTIIHYDASHLNGLILTGAMFNPLERGAHSMGGSTHKTLPGPRKGYLATNEPELAQRFAESASTFVSHHDPAGVVSLAITLIELRDCGGHEYGRYVVDHARRFASGLSDRGIRVAGAERGFTSCHQVWFLAPPDDHPSAVADRLFECGLVVNKITDLPGIEGDAFRFSSAEFARMGACEQDVEILIELVADAILKGHASSEIFEKVKELRKRLPLPRYCYEAKELTELGVPSELVSLCGAIEQHISGEWP